MKRAAVMLSAAVGALLLLAYARQRAAGAAYESPDAPEAPTLLDELDATASEAANLVSPTQASELSPSPELLDMLKAGEGLKLQRYRLGDGGWTIGYGRYFPDSGTPPPESIDLATAEEWFAADVESRGARWVRAYVNADVTQAQFDALTSMAYNLSPKSFKTIAAAVNNGEDPEQAALQFVRAGTNLERGLRNRRAREIALYREGVYA